MKVKEVLVKAYCYVVCLSEDEACKDDVGQEAIVALLQWKLDSGQKSVIGNKSYWY